MFSWLWKWLGAGADLSGLYIEDNVVWEVSPPQESSCFFLALRQLLPPQCNLYLESPLFDDGVEQFLVSCQLANPVKVRIGTIWPWPTWYHVAASPENLERLADLAKNGPNQDACIHLVAYENSRVLLSWYDAWTDPMWISTQYKEPEVASFAEQFECSYSMHHLDMRERRIQ